MTTANKPLDGEKAARPAAPRAEGNRPSPDDGGANSEGGGTQSEDNKYHDRPADDGAPDQARRTSQE